MTYRGFVDNVSHSYRQTQPDELMIKTDYKPNNKNKPIFSEKRKRSPLPVFIMAGTALALAIFGLSSLVFDSESEKPASSENISQLEIASVNEETTGSEVDESSAITGEIALSPKTEWQQQTPKSTSVPEKDNPEVESQQTVETTPAPKSEEPPAKPINWQVTRVKSGDSMARIFNRLKQSPRTLHDIMTSSDETQVLTRIKPGQELGYVLDDEGRITQLRYKFNALTTLHSHLEENGWQTEIETKEVDIQIAQAKGHIKSNLFLAGKEAGLTDSMIMELAGIFGWDIDFILDIRVDDEFTLVYEEKFVDNKKVGNGNILSAEFINQGKSFRAVRYVDSNGRAEYYTPEGLSMRKAFLRAPLDFKYISSNFNPRRFHPVLKRVKAHRGIDYSAPRGTPVRAAGDGKVIESGYDKYNGHHVFIQHGQKYTTKYLHFTKRKVRVGQRVKQGQIIGTVGSSGMVTGVHLHYEFLVNGVHRNPRTVKLPDAEPVDKSELSRFKQNTYAWVQLLDSEDMASEPVAYAD